MKYHLVCKCDNCHFRWESLSDKPKFSEKCPNCGEKPVESRIIEEVEK